MARPQDHLPRLNLPPFNVPQPGVNFPAQPMFSPAVQSYRPALPLPNPMQTPIQPFFAPQPPPASGRPLHHPGRASIAHLSSIGIHPPPGFTPGATMAGHHFPSMLGSIPGPSSSHPFPNRNRRQLSIGGPPKAVLGGPARKLSPLPAVAPASAIAPQKVKKVNVKLPKETIPAEQEGQPLTREPWARNLLDGFEYKEQQVLPVELASAEAYPPDEWRYHIPDTLDVFLPGKLAWEAMKQKEIEEKLEKLGVERGYGSNVPHIHAPHARAASISSPADPQILLYKLTKLQQSQEGASSGGNSLTTSPQLPFGGMSSSPHRSLTNRHGHTMSLAYPSSHVLDSNGTSFNPFGPGFEREVDPIPHSGPNAIRESVHSLAHNVASPTISRPDFIRGFGLDIPEEEEEGVENVAEEAIDEKLDDDEEQAIQYSPAQLASYSPKTERNVDEANTASQSRFHSRHASKLSAALSTRSVDALDADHFIEEEGLEMRYESLGQVDDQENNLDEDIVGEWTGSEDVYTGETSDGEESIGEWSNPSDEERVRKERLERRNRRRASAQIDVPRRIPNFPRPPDNTIAIPAHNEDIISNPSEEEARSDMARDEYLRTINYYPRPSNLNDTSQPLPHSRGPSAQHTAYDPAHAHSRASSNQNAVPGTQVQTQPTEALSSRHDSLNPFAKSFVFGNRGESGTWGQGSVNDITPPNAPVPTHVRLPSLGKPLNVAAPEFKPGRFTFRPPPGVPAMPPPPVEISQSDVQTEDPFRVQGREKRQRRGSTSPVEGDDSMVAFKFPAGLESPKSIRHSPEAVLTHKLDPSAEPFTFAGFSAAVATLPRVPREEDSTPEPEPQDTFDIGKVPEADSEEMYNEESTVREEVGNDTTNNEEPKSSATTNKPKRAPIPLDFKHPVSSNTVPAGLFKALNSSNVDERRRNTVRSRLGSRETFEHSRRPSMDDSNVTQIANKGGRPRYVTDPGHREFSPMDDHFGTSHSRRRSSFTDAILPLSRRLGGEPESDAPDDLTSEMSLTGQLDKDSNRPLETVIQDGFVNLQSDIKQHGKTQRKMISEIQAFLQAQYAEVVTHKNQLDARRELDLQMINDFVERSNNNLAQVLRDGLRDVRQNNWQAQTGEESSELVPLVEQIGNRTIDAVIEAISEASTRQEAIIRSAPAQERNSIIENLVSVLTPLMSSLRAEPIDYEFLTSELTQAVKPHISQLIDLASDKQETAGLIMDRLIPMLPTSNVDVDTITQTLTAEVRRAIAPIDAFEIKEQVADLVVERLDSRLAVRDKAFNIDSLSSKIAEGISKSLEPLEAVSASLERISASQTPESHQGQILLDHEHMVNLLSELPTKLSDELRSLQTTQTEILSKFELPQVGSEMDQNILVVKAAVEEISTSQKIIASQAEDLRSLHQLILDKLDTLPDSIHAATDALQNNHIDFLKSHEATKRELDELRKSNMDYQIQVTKARGAHGQIRVEKDVLSEKLISAESERDRLRDQVKDLQTYNAKQTTQVDTLTTRNQELEDALAAALTRLETSDVAMQAKQKHIEKLEEERLNLVGEKECLQTKVNSLDLQVTTANRDKESALQVTEALQQQHNVIMAQQSNWDELHSACEKIDIIASLIGNEELKELRRYRDYTKNLEHDHATLQKRLKELETKIGNNERTVATVKQSLTQAQQRSSEWERRAKESETQLEITHTKLDQLEQTHAQLDADYSLVKLQLEEREANDRLTQDQLNKLREQISLWENRHHRLQEELNQAQSIKVSRPYRNIAHGNTHPQTRPESRASNISLDRSATPQQSLNYSMSTVRNSTPTGSGTVWDSMHAPRTDAYKYTTPPQVSSPVTPRTHYPQPAYKLHAQAPPHRSVSPTPSTVSLAPTQDEDGWWS